MLVFIRHQNHHVSRISTAVEATKRLCRVGMGPKGTHGSSGGGGKGGDGEQWRRSKRRQHLLLDSAEQEAVDQNGLLVERENSERRGKTHRGSVIGRAYIDRDRKTGHENLVRDYFSPTPTFPHRVFRRRFRMSQKLFLRIHDAVVSYDDYFVQSRNAAHTEGLSSLQKVTAALRMLCYGVSGDMMDEYIRLAESTANEAMKNFIAAVITIFGDKYLRSPTSNDIARLLKLHESRGFPGMLGSIDCMHWTWKNCPSRWKGHYSGHCGDATVILEAVASRDLWIWHSFFGLPGSLNDINVLERSPVFTDLINGRAPPVNFVINNHQYDMGYYLADGIYPQWSTIVKSIHMPQTQKAQNYAKAQESARKDVERAFGVLQARFHIIRQPCRFFKTATMKNIMKACVIMHNMIVEEERDLYKSLEKGNYYLFEEVSDISLAREYEDFDYDQFIKGRQKLKDKTQHRRLQADLIEHLWERHGNIEY
ncbi:putative nuclease HARBI1 [Tripterygium wilfordii]|uniref:putative nuclease HARBI1 n=1 Tax=Tripterygium wilfordii TaxID=458696 RepID=UPI0018F81192|nr:putative nuclease HARBI1 [Tripterygium wilfordii]